TLATAMREDDKAGATGVWAGLLGFSQGANIAASLLRRQQSWKHYGHSVTGSSPASTLLEAEFRFAVLLAGRGPLLWMRSDVVDHNELEREKQEQLHLPTLHVHGLRDEMIARHRELVEYCQKDTARVLEWDGDHRVPIRSADVAALVHDVMSVAKETGVILQN
ncbi:hypothetical protein IL306_004223, partial [Fusarium sp. DS 682]